MMGWYGGGMGAGAWVFMGLFWVLLIGAIVWLVVQLTSSRHGSDGVAAAPRPWEAPAGGHGPMTAAGQSPLEVLDRRLAAGEIDVSTYREARAALVEKPGGTP